MTTNAVKHLADNIRAAALATIAKRYRARLSVFDAKRLDFAAMDALRLTQALADWEHGSDSRTPRIKLDRFQTHYLPAMVRNLRRVDGWTPLFDAEVV